MSLNPNHFWAHYNTYISIRLHQFLINSFSFQFFFTRTDTDTYGERDARTT